MSTDVKDHFPFCVHYPGKQDTKDHVYISVCDDAYPEYVIVNRGYAGLGTSEKRRYVPERTCFYTPTECGFTWWDENDNKHYEEYSASEDCVSASCSECGYEMMVGDDGWFNGWDEITEWTEEDGSEHKGYVLKPRFKFCPNCGATVTEGTLV